MLNNRTKSVIIVRELIYHIPRIILVIWTGSFY